MRRSVPVRDMHAPGFIADNTASGRDCHLNGSVVCVYLMILVHLCIALCTTVYILILLEIMSDVIIPEHRTTIKRHPGNEGLDC